MTRRSSEGGFARINFLASSKRRKWRSERTSASWVVGVWWKDGRVEAHWNIEWEATAEFERRMRSAISSEVGGAIDVVENLFDDMVESNR